MHRKTVTFILLAMLAAALTGCLVTSVYPFYTEKDLTFDPALLGQWSKADEKKEQWKFERRGTNAYLLTFVSDDQTNVMQAHLFKLAGQRFLDLFAPEKESEVLPPPIPSHLLLRVAQVTPTLRMTALNHDWLKDYLQKVPNAVRHELVQSGERPDDVRVVLTADTAELQKFILNQIKTNAAWNEEFELKKD